MILEEVSNRSNSLHRGGANREAAVVSIELNKENKAQLGLPQRMSKKGERGGINQELLMLTHEQARLNQQLNTRKDALARMLNEQT